MRPIVKNSTDQSVVIRIVDSGDGTPETGVAHDTPGIDLWYRREGATKTSITEASLSALDDAHSDGGILHIGDGYYRLDLPDAAVADGADGVVVGGTVTGMVVIGCYVPLIDAPASAAELAKVPKSDGSVSWNATALSAIQTQVAGALTSYDPPTRAEATADKDEILGVLGTPAVDVSADIAAVKSQTAAIETDTQDIQSRLPAALVNGRMSSDAVAISGSTTAADNVEANIGNLDAAISGIGGATGSGADNVTITLTDDDTGDPIADADVWVSTDADGDNVVAGTLQTDSNGQVTFLLDDTNTYYLWAQKDGWKGIRGTQFVASAD